MWFSNIEIEFCVHILGTYECSTHMHGIFENGIVGKNDGNVYY